MDGPYRAFFQDDCRPGRKRKKSTGIGMFLFLFLPVLLFGTHCSVPYRSTGPPVYPKPLPSVAPIPFSQSQIRDRLLAQLNTWKGTRYRLGGMSRRGIDCSGFVHITYRDQLGLRLPRTTENLARTGKRVPRRRLAPGDLVLFKTGWFGRHVGIYIGGFRFIHASKSQGVTVSSLRSGYWARRFWMARRVALPAAGS
jgi:hypothetical protein